MTTGPARALLRRLGQFLDQFSACVSRQPQRDAATQYIDGLFGDSERKSMQAMHGRLGEPRDEQALQHVITHSPWDAARVWAQRRAVVPIRTGILALDDTGFPTQGTQSPGVQRQYCGALGKIGNCQVAVSSALIADGRTWPLAFELYVPTSWTDAPARCAAAGIPATGRFRETWRIALAQVRTVLQAGFTITGVVVDADDGANAAFRAGLERLGLAYGVAIRGEATFAVPGVEGTASAILLAASAPEDAWETVPWGTGTAGPLTAQFCALRVRPPNGRGERWRLCERSATDARKYYLLHLPAMTPLSGMCATIAVEFGGNINVVARQPEALEQQPHRTEVVTVFTPVPAKSQTRSALTCRRVLLMERRRGGARYTRSPSSRRERRMMNYWQGGTCYTERSSRERRRGHIEISPLASRNLR